jgi:alpha/beta superfamily hydrolase
MKFTRWTGPFLPALAFCGSLHCAGQPPLVDAPPSAPEPARSASAAPATAAPAAAAPATPPKFDLDALLARERPALDVLPVADPEGHWHAKIEARMPPTIEAVGNLVRVQADVGTEKELRCEITNGQIEPGVALANLFRATAANIALESVAAYRITSVQDVPVLFVAARYSTRATPPLAGELKIGISPRSQYSVVCLQDEPGYRAAFARSVESFLTSMEADERPRTPQMMSLWQFQAGQRLTGYRWDRMYAEPDGSLSSYSFEVFLAQLASGEVRIRDDVAARVHDRSGISQANLLSYRGNTKAYEVKLERAQNGKYTYKGEVGGKTVTGNFKPEAALAGDYELFSKLLQSQASAQPLTIHQQEYLPGTNPSGPVAVEYALDPSSHSLSFTKANKSSVWALNSGLPVSTRVTEGPNTYTGSVIAQHNSLAATPGVTLGAKPVPDAGSPLALSQRRQGFETKVNGPSDHTPAPTPPAGLLSKVRYPAPLGDNVAYVSPPRAGAKRPAIVWLASDIQRGIGKSAWAPAPRKNDPSARAFREAGLVLMLPALRGTNENPGQNECLFGEVDDVIAAAAYLATRSDVDPERIYLGGHGAGGTLALLVAATSPRFRSVFAFGPVADARQYGTTENGGCLPEAAAEAEVSLRSPVNFVSSIRTPTFVFEGGLSGNSPVFDELREQASGNVHFSVTPGTDHYGILAPGTASIARAIARDQVDDTHLLISP